MKLVVILFQILTLYDSLETIDVDRAVSFVKGLQQEDGSFYGDKWGESTTGMMLYRIGRFRALVLNVASFCLISQYWMIMFNICTSLKQ